MNQTNLYITCNYTSLLVLGLYNEIHAQILRIPMSKVHLMHVVPPLQNQVVPSLNSHRYYLSFQVPLTTTRAHRTGFSGIISNPSPWKRSYCYQYTRKHFIVVSTPPGLLHLVDSTRLQCFVLQVVFKFLS